MSESGDNSPRKAIESARPEPLKLGGGLGLLGGGRNIDKDSRTAPTQSTVADSATGEDVEGDSDESFELDEAEAGGLGSSPDSPTGKKKEPLFIKRRFIGTNSTHIKLAFIGNTNVGKSSLFNLFIDQELSPVEDSIFTTTELYVGNLIPEDYKFEYYNKAYKPAISTR